MTGPLEPVHEICTPDTYGACDLPMITLPSTLTTVDLQHGYRSVGPIQREHATAAQPTLFRGGKIFTIQPFSRKCPIGHALDIPFENWTSSSLRIYITAVASQIACHTAIL